MYYRVFKYFTRPALFAADRERREAGIRSRHAHPPFKELPKKGRFVVKMAYPFNRGCGDGIPQVKCFIMCPEIGLAWNMDITVERFRRLPSFTTENPHAYRL